MASETKRLADLGLITTTPDTIVTGLAVDSREVQPGFLFAALPGTQVHGAEFIQYALRQGAKSILTDAAGAKIAADVIAEFAPSVCIVENPRLSLAMAANLWFDGQPNVMVAVTGTNGKTSVATFCRQIWLEMGLSAVNLGTTGVEGAWSAPLQHTTPEPITLHRTLQAAHAAGVTHAAMEASSHGLAQYRLDGVKIAAAGFTNFTQDHLDYHATFDEYFDAKSRLFGGVLSPGGVAVINIDDPRGADMVKIARANGHPVMTVGADFSADLHISAQRFDATGQDLLIKYQGKSHLIRLPLVGGFQGENVTLAAGVVIAAGANADEVFDSLSAIHPVRGRMELAATRENGASVFVDYAHTPDAVETALTALRPHVMGRLIVIVGAGGDRDPGKRILMGQAAARHADVVFVTDDNPRTEDPATIRSMVMQGAPDATEVADRAEAILRAVDALAPGDTLLIAGKGHETGQIVGTDVLPFDDVEQASVAVAALEGML
ncbi:MAG: UDP-N-acetylmuramoyl-L-alanyl-D-glutamate--2,6-diaminopimelate ligase [Planktomarina sp.]